MATTYRYADGTAPPARLLPWRVPKGERDATIRQSRPHHRRENPRTPVAAHALSSGPANVALRRLGIRVDAGDPRRGLDIAPTVDRSAVRMTSRLVFHHADLARAYAGLRSRDDDAVRHLLIAERVAPQHVHSSPLRQETTRALLDRTRRRAGGAALRCLAERMAQRPSGNPRRPGRVPRS